MAYSIINLMYPLYNTFTEFTCMTFDETSASSLFDTIAGTVDPAEKTKVEVMRENFQNVKIEAARVSLILNGFINRYEVGVIGESEIPKILDIIRSSLDFAKDVYEQLQYAKNKTVYDRYLRHAEIEKKLHDITMVRQAIEVYNSKLVDFSEIDQVLENYPYGAMIFDSALDNESIKNDIDIIYAKLTALLIKLKDGGVKWADTILNKISSEPQKADIPTTSSDETVTVNELDQN